MQEKVFEANPKTAKQEYIRCASNNSDIGLRESETVCPKGD